MDVLLQEEKRFTFCPEMKTNPGVKIHSGGKNGEEFVCELSCILHSDFTIK